MALYPEVDSYQLYHAQALYKACEYESALEECFKVRPGHCTCIDAVVVEGFFVAICQSLTRSGMCLSDMSTASVNRVYYHHELCDGTLRLCGVCADR